MEESDDDYYDDIRDIMGGGKYFLKSLEYFELGTRSMTGHVTGKGDDDAGVQKKHVPRAKGSQEPYHTKT